MPENASLLVSYGVFFGLKKVDHQLGGDGGHGKKLGVLGGVSSI